MPSYPLEMSEAEWQGYLDLGGHDDESLGNEILDFFVRLHGIKVVAAGLSLHKRLRGEIWRTQDGQELRPNEMTVGHAMNLSHWLERRAKVVRLGGEIETHAFSATPFWAGTELAEAAEAAAFEIAETDPLDYLATLPLYRKICERATQQESIPRRRSIFSVTRPRERM